MPLLPIIAAVFGMLVASCGDGCGSAYIPAFAFEIVGANGEAIPRAVIGYSVDSFGPWWTPPSAGTFECETSDDEDFDSFDGDCRNFWIGDESLPGPGIYTFTVRAEAHRPWHGRFVSNQHTCGLTAHRARIELVRR